MTPPPALNPPIPPPVGCAAFDAVLTVVLDRDLPPSALDDPHTADCAACRGRVAAARALLAGLATMSSAEPPRAFAEWTTAVVVRDRARRVRARWVGRAGLAVAASVTAVVLIARPWQPPAEPSDLPKPQELADRTPTPSAPPRPEPVGERFAEAGDALAALTRRTAAETVSPALSLVPDSAPDVTLVPRPLPAQPVTQALAAMPDAARAGLEPITASAVRAVNLFLRDTGLAAPPRPNS